MTRDEEEQLIYLLLEVANKYEDLKWDSTALYEETVVKEMKRIIKEVKLDKDSQEYFLKEDVDGDKLLNHVLIEAIERFKSTM